MANQHYFYAVGRRKTAVAQVRLFPNGNGTVIVNGKPLSDILPRPLHQHAVMNPFVATETMGKYNVTIKASGGGLTGWADAICMGVARALVVSNEGFRLPLRRHGLLTRDARAKERKKYGLKRARKAPQYTKR
ncbi:MAG: 30S ribosomal protein S9 [Dehalococcoidia bacterium]|nr:30S ribosomal protein S9 [Dehalococcoidia bacterium]